LILLSLRIGALWLGSEPVLSAYIVGMILAKTMEKDVHFVSRLRTLTVGFLTPLYFLRAGALVSIPTLFTVPLLFLILFFSKLISKIGGLYPTIRYFNHHKNENYLFNFKHLTRERWYYTLLMSTGLTFGTISALYGLSNQIINQHQYSLIVGAAIASAIIPTLIANKFSLPVHLVKPPVLDDQIPEERDIKRNLYNGTHKFTRKSWSCTCFKLGN